MFGIFVLLNMMKRETRSIVGEKIRLFESDQVDHTSGVAYFSRFPYPCLNSDDRIILV